MLLTCFLALLALLTTALTARTKDGFLWTPKSTTHGLVTDAFTTSTSNINSDYDVIVIGAGFAGLTAAREIAASDCERTVLLVEARDRIGGRTWTAKAFGDWYEMGGAWVHWSQAHVYRELVRYGIDRDLKTSSPFIPNLALDKIADQFFNIDNYTARELMPWPYDPLRTTRSGEPQLWRKYSYISLQERLDQLTGISQSERDQFEAIWGLVGYQDPSQISFNEALKAYATCGFSMQMVLEFGGSFLIGKGGTTRLAKAMLEEGRYDRLFGSPVTKIEQSKEGVVVKLVDGSGVRAKYVVNTVPLNVAGSIIYEPALPQLLQEAYRVGQQNRCYKFNFRLATPQPGLGALKPRRANTSLANAFAEMTDREWDPEETPSGTNVISFGYNDRFPKGVENSSFVLSALSDVIDMSVGASEDNAIQVAGYLSHDWAADPYANGTWSSWKPGAEDKYLGALQEPRGRVYFASSDWASGSRGYIDGAIEQGLRAAMGVSRALGEERRVQSRSKEGSQVRLG